MFHHNESDHISQVTSTGIIQQKLRLTFLILQFAHVRDLFVLPEHRRAGVGRALLASVRAAAIASGALRLVLQTEEDNDAALRLYADSGYTLVGGYCSLMLPISPDTRGS